LLLALFTELLAHGGIQRMGRHVCSALDGAARKRRMRFVALSLRDPNGSRGTVPGDGRVEFRGFGGDKLAFSSEAFRQIRSAALVYIGHPRLAALSFAAAGVRPRPPVWVQAYGVEVWKELPALSRMSLRCADKVLGISADTMERLRRVQQISGDRISYLPPALEPGLDHAAEAAPARSHGPVILTVSRLDEMDPYKGIENVLRAVKGLIGDFPSLRYRLVGDGSDRSRLEAVANGLGIQDRVAFLGSVDEATLASEYRSCDAFILPSLREGFGIVYLEAMAHGKPVIGVDCAGTRDVVREGDSGLLLRDDSAAEIERRLREVLNDRSLRSRLGAGGAAISKEFSLEALTDRIDRMLDQEGLCASSM